MATQTNEYYLSCITQALDLAEEMALGAIAANHHYFSKGDRDFALEVDHAVETEIRALLARLTPTIPMLGEEKQWDTFEQPIPDLFWVVDPIDGTVNYSRQIPLFGITIALIYRNKPIVAGIAFPALGDRHTAIKGQGAWLNGQKIHVSKTQNIRDAIIGIGDFSVGENAPQKNAITHALMQHYAGQCLRIRMLGTAALQLAWLATGRLDLSITLSNKSWDVQAGVLLVEEAGGLVFDEDGSDHDLKSCRTLATNAYLKTRLLKFFRQYKTE